MSDNPVIWAMAKAHWESVAGLPWETVSPIDRDRLYDAMYEALKELRDFRQEMYDAISDLGVMWRELDSRTVWTAIIDRLLEIPNGQEAHQDDEAG